MGNEAAAMAQEAEQSKEIIHYLATNTFLGEVNMQTMYMTWIAMAIVFVCFCCFQKSEVSTFRIAECHGVLCRFSEWFNGRQSWWCERPQIYGTFHYYSLYVYPCIQ